MSGATPPNAAGKICVLCICREKVGERGRMGCVRICDSTKSGQRVLRQFLVQLLQLFLHLKSLPKQKS